MDGSGFTYASSGTGISIDGTAQNGSQAAVSIDGGTADFDVNSGDATIRGGSELALDVTTSGTDANVNGFTIQSNVPTGDNSVVKLGDLSSDNPVNGVTLKDNTITGNVGSDGRFEVVEFRHNGGTAITLDGNTIEAKFTDGTVDIDGPSFLVADGQVSAQAPDLDVTNNTFQSSGNVSGTTLEIGNIVFGIRGEGFDGTTIGGPDAADGNTFDGIRVGVQVNQARSSTYQNNTFKSIASSGLLFSADAQSIDVRENDFSNVDFGVAFSDGNTNPFSDLLVKNNDFTSISEQAIATFNGSGDAGGKLTGGAVVDARQNFFGATDGPGQVVDEAGGQADGQARGSGAAVTANVTFVPFLPETADNNPDPVFPNDEIVVDPTQTGPLTFSDVSSAVDEALPEDEIVLRDDDAALDFAAASDIVEGDDRVDLSSTFTGDDVVTITLTADGADRELNSLAIDGGSVGSGPGELDVSIGSANGGTLVATKTFDLSSVEGTLPQSLLDEATVSLESGDLAVTSSGAFEIADGGGVVRGDGEGGSGAVTSGSFGLGKNVDVVYFGPGNTADNFDGVVAGGELGDGTTGNLLVLVGSDGRKVQFEQNVDARTFYLGDGSDTVLDQGSASDAQAAATFTGDFAVTRELDADDENSNDDITGGKLDGKLSADRGAIDLRAESNGSDLTVEGVFSITGLLDGTSGDDESSALTVANGATYNGDVDTPGDVIVDSVATGVTALSADGNSSLSSPTIAVSDLKLRLASSEAKSNSDSEFDVSLAANGASSNTEISIEGTVQTNLRSNLHPGGNTKDLDVDIAASNSTNDRIEVAGGTFQSVDLSGGPDATLAATDDITLSFGDGDVSNSTVQIGASTNGTIEVQDGVTLTVENNDTQSGNVLQHEFDDATGTGTIVFTGSENAGGHQFDGANKPIDPSVQVSTAYTLNSGSETFSELTLAEGADFDDGSNAFNVQTNLTVNSQTVFDGGVSFTENSSASTLSASAFARFNGSVTFQNELTDEIAQTNDTDEMLFTSGLTVEDPGSSPTNGLEVNDGIRITGTLDIQADGTGEENAVGGTGTITFEGSGSPAIESSVGSSSSVSTVDTDVSVETDSNTDVTVGSSTGETILFGEQLSLADAGVTVNNSNNDLSPISDGSPSIRVNVASDGTTIGGSGTFNAEENQYALTYFGDVDDGQDTGSEITAFVGDFTVASDAIADLESSVSPSGEVDISGTLNGPSSIDLTDADPVLVTGTLNAPFSSSGALTLDGEGTGSFGDVTATGTDADVTLTNFLNVGNVTVADEGTMTISLSGDHSDDASEQAISSIDVGGDGALTLNSDAFVDGGIDVGDSDASGTLAIGGNTLTQESGDFSGTENAVYNSDGGTFVLETSGTAGTSGQPVENLTIADGSDVTIDGDLAFNGEVTLNAGLSGAGNDGDVLTATGSTVTINGEDDLSVPNFTIDSGDDGTTTIADATGSDAGDTDSDAENLVVSGELTFASGELDHQTSVEVGESLTYAPASEDAADFAVTASGGSVVLDGADVTLNRALTVPSLETSGGSSLVANSDDNPFDLRIGSDLTLGAPFDASADNTGDLVITSAEGENVQVERTSYSGTDVLTQPLVFEEPGTTYDLTYTGSSDINSGLEAVDGSGQGQIDSLKVNASATVTFSDAELSGSVTANERLELLDGTVQHTASDERQVAIADGATLLRDDGSFADRTNPSDQVNADGAYTLVYASDGEEDGVGDATDEEFLSDTEIDLVVRTAEDGDTDEVLNVLPGNRTVSSLTVENDTGDETSLGDGSDSFTLTVNGGTEINGGLLDGSLNAQGDVTVAEGDVSEAALTFAGNSDQALSLSETEEVSGIELAQTTPDGESVPSVTVSGGGLEPTSAPTFGNGLLVVEGDNALDLSANDVGFTRDVADGDESHVVGEVKQSVTSGDGLVTFPVGSAEPTYRPFSTELPSEGDDRDLTVEHANEDPGTEGLPTNSDETDVTITETPSYQWTVVADQPLSIANRYEISLRGTGLNEENADDFRILRNQVDSGFEQIGDGTAYDNENRTAEGNIDVRTVGATASLVDEERTYTVGVPGEQVQNIAGTVSYPSEEGVGSGTPSFTSGEGLGGVEVA
ncbi:beta strand repeat-containing protein, partial [Salinibacter ruber]|uniref:beta strand repeat-containing protein n=1 Tax=Salinibacter ruber TaxID=146919 RepID=UPI002166FDDC